MEQQRLDVFFMKCEAGKFHQNSEFCRVDFQPFKLNMVVPLLDGSW